MLSFHLSRQSGLRLGVPVLAIALMLMAVGTVLAGSPNPGSIHVSQGGALTVEASGTWIWHEMDTAPKLSYAGFAIDWGDVTSGNAVGKYHIGDGTAATNFVLQPTTPAQGSSGSFGPVSHTYAQAGSYTVCAIVYDLGEVKPFKATGYHSLRAGGVGRNTDNSVDQKMDPPVLCTTIDVGGPTPTPAPTATPTPTPFVEGDPTPTPTPSVDAPTPTPFESFEGVTSNPTSTPPVTSTTTDQTPDQGLSWLTLAMLFGSMLASVFVFKVVRLDR